MPLQTDEERGPIAIRQWIVPAYVFACLMIGGSPQGIGFSLALQLVGILLIAWSAAAPPVGEMSPNGRALLILILSFIALLGAQLIPLPPGIWSALPGRDFIEHGDRLLELSGTWRPITLSADSSIAAAMALIPPLAILISMVRSKAYRPALLFGTILVATLLSILLGLLQRGDVVGRWNLYPIANFGVATGTFANANFFGSLLLTSIPVAAALLLADRASSAASRSMARSAPILGIFILFVFIGMALNQSLAVALLSAPAIALTLFLAIEPGQVRISRMIWFGLAIVIFGGILLALMEDLFGISGGSASIQERYAILKGSIRTALEFFPIGSGLGTFPTIYPILEDPNSVTRFIVNHAHNDYLEALIELGCAGILLIIAFLCWWSITAAQIWKSPERDSFARAGTIISAILLLHSLVDYPLRTSALAAIFAAAIGLMVVQTNTTERSARRPKHIRLD